MSDLKAKLIDQNLYWLDNPEIYSGDIKTDKIHFDFCSNWDNYLKTAVFYRGKNEVYQQMLDDNNTCVIPHEILSREGLICIGVYGVNGDHVLTSQAIKYRIKAGAVSDQLGIDPPTLTIYEQVISKYGEVIVDQATFIETQTDIITTLLQDWLDYSEAMDATMEECTNKTNTMIENCENIISQLQLEYRDLDGGTPTTEEVVEEYDGEYA